MGSSTPPDPSRSQKPGWRDAAKPAGSQRPAGNQPAWRSQPTAAAPVKASSGRTWKIVLVGTLLLGVIGGIIAWIFFIKPPKPIHVVLLGAGYENNLAIPHNAAGIHGLDDLEAWAKKRPDLVDVERRELKTDPAALDKMWG